MIVIRRSEKDIEALSGVTVDPSDLEDDGTNWEGVRVDKPWGHEVERYRNESVAVCWLHLHARSMTSLHCHTRKDAMIFVVAGSGVLETLNGEHAISEGELIIIERGAFHRAIALATSLILYEVENPPHKRDLVRLNDSYGRGQGYEKICANTTL